MSTHIMSHNDIKHASKLHSWTHSPHHQTLTIFWKYMITSFLVISIDIKNPNISSTFHSLWVIIFLLGILYYSTLSLYLIYNIYYNHNNGMGVFVSQTDELSVFHYVISSNWCR
eukprot:24404_1